MKTNPRIYVRAFDAMTVEDVFEKGEVGGTYSCWNSSSLGFRNAENGYGSVAEAIAAVCKANGFKYDRDGWTSYGADTGEDYGRFDGGFLVDDDNSEATASQIARWKEGKQKLYACYLSVRLEVRTVRELTSSEAKSF